MKFFKNGFNEVGGTFLLEMEGVTGMAGPPVLPIPKLDKEWRAIEHACLSACLKSF